VSSVIQTAEAKAEPPFGAPRLLSLFRPAFTESTQKPVY
jgi:hypothetical protein